MQKSTAASSLTNQAHFPWRNKLFSPSTRQPECWSSRRNLRPQRSTADDINAAKHAWKEYQRQQASSQNGDVPPNIANDAPQQQLDRIAQEILKEVAPKGGSDTSTHMGYDELMDMDHEPADDGRKPVQSQFQEPVKVPQPGTKVSWDWTNPQAFLKHRNLLQVALTSIFNVIAGLVVLFLAWQAAKLIVRGVMSLAHIHTWLMIMAFLVTALITPQAPKVNGLLRFVNDYNLFATYGQAKNVLSMATWSSIACFLVLVFFAGSTY